MRGPIIFPFMTMLTVVLVWLYVIRMRRVTAVAPAYISSFPENRSFSGEQEELSW